MPFFEPLEKMDPKHVDLERARKSLGKSWKRLISIRNVLTQLLMNH
jgi:hypothetical protein